MIESNLNRFQCQCLTGIIVNIMELKGYSLVDVPLMCDE